MLQPTLVLMLRTCFAILLATVSTYARTNQQALNPSQIASLNNFGTSTSLAFPTQSLGASDATSFLVSHGWDITKKGHVAQENDTSFISDPITKDGWVYAIDYPKGSLSGTGGAEFSTYWNNSGTAFGSMLVHYEVAFDPNFQWALGGKLPGLRGGSLDGCSGGKDSPDCFSVRLMWRADGKGEAYAYIAASTSFCAEKDVRCNEDGYGTSIDRGLFVFVSSGWNEVDMIVQLNNPPNSANGIIQVYYNGLIAVNKTGLQIRSQDSITGITGLFFSTFFGGNNASWESPIDQHAYFRNFQMWASESFSKASSGITSAQIPSIFQLLTLVGSVVLLWIPFGI
ncbi:uncharacterized protein EI90DRAFT_3291304 [Cantharellus anzutake]|uniref:uncharacterized protein n=1 Tax=Cantharellus anzutake TaxID=1750568 RepID=UPI0019059CBA|nr:uncharacterized protein EI90DRAFT_3291304 [Cantharellus anzutake]KAF8326600.1 hypothetical protein EI90DRAFT_3291304 [Cantharellus anzutake]